jgi:WD40 repeat protein
VESKEGVGSVCIDASQERRHGKLPLKLSLPAATFPLRLIALAVQGEGWISRQAAGLCFDFLPDDLSAYVVGTEEGSLHKCSVSYNEQYLETYTGHDGPIYRVKFSKNCPEIFLTCSADWSIGLYNVRHQAPLVVMKSSGEDFSVNDICWCPGNSTVCRTNPDEPYSMLTSSTCSHFRSLRQLHLTPNFKFGIYRRRSWIL